MCRRFRSDGTASGRRSVAVTMDSAALKKGGDRAARRVCAALNRLQAGQCRRGRKMDESSAATRRDTMLRHRASRAHAAASRCVDRCVKPGTGHYPWRSHRAEAIRTRTMRPCFMKIRPALRCRTRRPCGARPDTRIGPVIVPPAGGQWPSLVRQACVRFSDDFAVFQVERPGFCDQLANTCKPASGFGGTVRDIRRLHDETPEK